MKLHVVKDKSGKVVASYEAAASGGATVSPVLEHGATEAEIEVGGNYHENLKELYK